MDKIAELDSMEKFDNFLKVLSYYHVERCEYEDCRQCIFTINLRYLYVENTVQGNNFVVPLPQFCISKIDKFKRCRAFINTLVKLEKVRILVENEFHKTLELWNKPEATS